MTQNHFEKFNPPIFASPNLDEEVKTKQRLLYDSLVYNRRLRYSNAVKEWMKDFTSEPLPFKQNLEQRIASLESLSDLSGKVLDILNDYKNKLQAGEYCEGSNAHALYRGSYEDRQLAFVWPTQEELDLRQQEESELLAQINK